MTEVTTQSGAQLRIRIVFADGTMLGPGKADLLQFIEDTGSIAAAGRRMGMSYKRAWMLVETMNAAFSNPLIESVRGGAKGGGASLTPSGKQVLEHYRAVESNARQGGETALAQIETLLRSSR